MNFVSDEKDKTGDGAPEEILRRGFATLGLVLSMAMAMAMAMATFAPIRAAASESSLILATTTSVRDSGLLDALLPRFTKESGIEVRVIAVGTGAALRMGREGNADVLLTHAPDAEQALIDDGVVMRRTPFMQNFFVIAGPSEDPADVASADSPADALRRIATSQSNWVSRSDESGTHKREEILFEAAGVPADANWKGFDRTGSGMGLSLQVAGEHRAYILTDIGTFLAFQKRIGLVALSKPADTLLNVYSVLQLDATRFERPLASSAAVTLERFLIDNETQDQIGRYGQARFGRPLFTPLHAGDAVPNRMNAIAEGTDP